MNKKILIICLYPPFKKGIPFIGGVGNYINLLIKWYQSNSFKLECFMAGRRPGKDSKIYYLIYILYDYIRLFLALFNKQYYMVHFNPSLDKISFVRDCVFLLITRLHKKKILIFWHGWERDFERRIDSNVLLLTLFKIIYGRADAFVVLASTFKKKFRKWGFNQEIYIETPAIDDRIVAEFSLNRKIDKIYKSRKLQILFLSRIELSKGIIETIDAFSSIFPKDRELALVIAGDGPDVEFMRKHVKKLGDYRIKIVGFIKDNKKRRILENSHLLCLPTFAGEGLPAAIIEAMAFGMSIITRPVGGIPNIFKDGENGYYAKSLDRDSLARILKDILCDKEEMCRIATNNYLLAQQRFLASVVVKRLDRIYKKTINV